MMNATLTADLQSWADKLATAADADALAERFAALLKAEGIEAGAATRRRQHHVCIGIRYFQHSLRSSEQSERCHVHKHLGHHDAWLLL